MKNQFLNNSQKRMLSIRLRRLHQVMILNSKNILLGLICFVVSVFSGNTWGQTSPQDYATNGTFTVPVGVTTITIQCWGAGGGGGNSTSGNSSGGGGGGAFASVEISVTPGQVVSYFVGTGAANTNGGNSYATYGGSTVVLAGGGKKGAVTGGGVGGSTAASVGDVKFAGGSGLNGRGSGTGGGSGGGGAGTTSIGLSGSSSGATSTGGAGGATDGGKGGNAVKGAIGSAGVSFGGGGGGANGVVNGGAGAIGHVRITWTAPPKFQFGTLTTNPSPLCMDELGQISIDVTNNFGSDIGSVNTYKIDYSWNNSTWTNGASEVKNILNTETKTFIFNITPTLQGSLPLYLRIRNNSDATIYTTKTVSLTVANCNPAGSDNCATATAINTTGLYEGTTASFTADSPNWLNGSTVFGGSTIENNSFYKFIAANTNISFTICGNCSTSGFGGIQALIFTGTCGTIGSINKVFYMKQLCGDCGGVTASYGTGITGSGSKSGNCYSVSISGLTIGQTYYYMVDGFEGSNCPFSIQFGLNSVLPVELTYFTGEAINEGNLIQWETASEIINDYFELQSSLDGEVFNTIAILDGAGNSAVTLNYAFLDREPVGMGTYYRLRQVDFNGDSETFDPIYLKRASNGKIFVSPNPVVNSLFVEIDVKKSGNYSFDLISVSGQRIQMNRFLEIGLQTVELNMNNLAKGFYILQVSDVKGEVLTIQKIIKE